jgi:hypothetical protein
MNAIVAFDLVFASCIRGHGLRVTVEKESKDYDLFIGHDFFHNHSLEIHFIPENDNCAQFYLKRGDDIFSLQKQIVTQVPNKDHIDPWLLHSVCEKLYSFIGKLYNDCYQADGASLHYVPNVTKSYTVDHEHWRVVL